MVVNAVEISEGEANHAQVFRPGRRGASKDFLPDCQCVSLGAGGDKADAGQTF